MVKKYKINSTVSDKCHNNMGTYYDKNILFNNIVSHTYSVFISNL